MKCISAFGRKLEGLCKLYLRIGSTSMSPLFHYNLSHPKPFSAQLCYFLVLSAAGYLALKASRPIPAGYGGPRDLDLFFTSVSAATVSSMSTVEMEAFSTDQLIIITLLMLLGGEVFTSLLGLLLHRLSSSSSRDDLKISSCVWDLIYNNSHNQNSADMSSEHQVIIELGMTTTPPPNNHKKILDEGGKLRHNSIKSLGYIVLGYLIVVQVLGSCLVSLYMSLTPSANRLLRSKGISMLTFSFVIIVSTFANGGFVPTNENMVVFRKNPGLLLLLVPQILLGNTLYAPCLRLVVWVLERFTRRREYAYILRDYKGLQYAHLKSSRESWFLVGSAFLFILVQYLVFSIMEWSSGVMEGMSSYEKLVGSLFEVVNSRSAGESIVDLSAVSSAVLVLFVVMMYLQPYTSFLPIGDRQESLEDNKNTKQKHKKSEIIENMLFSQLSYLAILVIVICIIERKSMKEDPLNFNVLNVVVEVISAYGNVGFSTGYSCKRRLDFDGNCRDAWYGFAGRWSDGGKLVLISVMIFGRLKRFNKHGGKAWKPV